MLLSVPLGEDSLYLEGEIDDGSYVVRIAKGSGLISAGRAGAEGKPACGLSFSSCCLTSVHMFRIIDGIPFGSRAYRRHLEPEFY